MVAIFRNPDDPLNKGSFLPSPFLHPPLRPNADLFSFTFIEAAEDLRRDRAQFARNVATSLKGGSVRGERYDKMI